MLPNNDDNISGGPSLIWTIKTAFNNYQTIIDKYENLLLENVALNTSVTEKLGELSTKLEKMPDRYTLSNVDNKLSKISEKLTKMILIVAIVGGIGISTYVWINHQIDKRIENLFPLTKQSLKLGVQMQTSQSGLLNYQLHDMDYGLNPARLS